MPQSLFSGSYIALYNYQSSVLRHPHLPLH
ncbi:hypothetical protein KCV26_09415 [Petrimonas sulfuriphila]